MNEALEQGMTTFQKLKRYFDDCREFRHPCANLDTIQKRFQVTDTDLILSAAHYSFVDWIIKMIQVAGQIDRYRTVIFVMACVREILTIPGAPMSAKNFFDAEGMPLVHQVADAVGDRWEDWLEDLRTDLFDSHPMVGSNFGIFCMTALVNEGLLSSGK